MAAEQGVEGFIEIADFKPGIWSARVGGERVVAPPGAAQPSFTQGCIATMSGALGPGPKVITADTQAPGLYTNTQTASTYRPTTRPYQQTLATSIFSPVTSLIDAGTTPGLPQWERPDHLFVATADFYDAAGASQPRAHFFMRGFNLGLEPEVAGPNYSVITTSATRFVGGRVDLMRYGTASLLTGWSVLTAGTGLTNFEVPFLFGTVSLASNIPGNAPDWDTYTYPAAATYNSADTLGSLADADGPISLAVFHQGRFVGARPFEATGTASYGSTAGGTQRHIDRLTWNPNVNEAAVETDPYEYGNYVMEGGGIATLASMSANTLLVIKQTGGGFVIRGDLARPQVQRLPGLPPAMGAGCVPAQTPIGCVFGTRDGVWMWNDGNAVQLLSPQLDGWFWKAGSTIDNYMYIQPKGKFNYRHPYVLAPNDWMFDTTSLSWWKLPTTQTGTRTPYFSYEVSLTGHVYAFTVAQNATSNVLYNRFDFDEEAPYYTWRSHAIAPTLDRRLRFREFNLRAEGAGTVVLALHSDGVQIATKTFTLTSAGIQSFRAGIGISNLASTYSGTDVTLSITAGATDGTTPAPTIHAVRIGYLAVQSQ